MNASRSIRWLFAVAALYDGILGAIFLVLPGWPFDLFGVTAPNHSGYVRFPAALLLTFGIMFAAVAVRPLANRNLIPYGILLKVSYCGVVFAYWFAEGIPAMWKPFAVADLVFIVLFAWAYVRLGRQAA
jgi:hypothetical protein